MKKIIYSLVALGTLTLVSCSDEDKLPTINYKGCQVCEVEGTAPNFIAEDYEVCVAEDRQNDSTAVETAYVDGASTGIAPQRYFELFCDNAYDPNNTGGGNGENPGENPGSGSGTNCVSCAAYTVPGATEQVPQQAVCKSADGFAIVNGVTSTVPYDQYITAQEMLTDCK